MVCLVHRRGLSHKSKYIFKKCVNVNGSPLDETSKYLLTVLTNWETTSSASYYLVSEQHSVIGLQESRVTSRAGAQATY